MMGSGGGKARLAIAEMLFHGNMTDDTVSNQRRLPDPKKCRTMYLGQALDLSECLVENPDGCEFAVSFGFGVYCYHSDRRSFEKTDLH
jgi:hypothetical protein